MDFKSIYIEHSCYLIELEKNIFIFDYYQGEIPDYIFDTNKNITFLSSHSHYDHYNEKILDWRQNKNVNYVFSDDIYCEDKNNISFMKSNEKLILGENVIYTFDSTDLGVSFLIKSENISIFHAGDLNFWHWKEESLQYYVDEARLIFKNIVEDINKHEVDFAMFPTDPRMGRDYYEGSEIFINKVKPKVFAPMHFDGQQKPLDEFIDVMKKYDHTKLIVPVKQNEEFIIKI